MLLGFSANNEFEPNDHPSSGRRKQSCGDPENLFKLIRYVVSASL